MVSDSTWVPASSPVLTSSPKMRIMSFTLETLALAKACEEFMALTEHSFITPADRDLIRFYIRELSNRVEESEESRSCIHQREAA